MANRVVYVPKENYEYTFRRFDRNTQKPIFDTYRFYGEITESGRYVLFEVNRQYPTSVTVERFSYIMRKNFVKQKDLETGVTYYNVSKRNRQRLSPAKKESTNAKVDKAQEPKDEGIELVDKIIRVISVYPDVLFNQITAQTGVEREVFLEELENYKSMYESPLKDTALNNIKKKWDKFMNVTLTPQVCSMD